MSTNFKKGVLFGSLLGAGIVWLTSTKKGRETRDHIVQSAHIVYDRVKKEVHKAGGWEKFTKTKYAALVDELTDRYAKEIGLAERYARIIKKMVRSQWIRLKEEMK